MTPQALITTPHFGALGAVLAVIYCAVLWWNVRIYLGEAAWRALPLHMLRIVGAASIFALCARQGAMPLLASFAGFLIARTVIVSRYRTAIGEPG